jgi:iron complex outermembrane receptor protein
MRGRGSVVAFMGGAALVAGWPTEARGQPSASKEERQIEKVDLQTLLNTPVDVWTPSKTTQPSYEAPSIITTVTREQIAIWGYKTVAELLDHLLGFYVVDDHDNPNVLVRGNSGGLYSDSSILKVLINGVPIAFNWTGGIGLGPELIPLSAIDRVEVIRGPASAVYGADAFLALINIHTREKEDLTGGTAWLTLGQVGRELATDADVIVGVTRGVVEALAAFRHTSDDLSRLELPASSPAPNIPFYNAGHRTTAGEDQESTTAIGTVTLRLRPTRTVRAYGYYSAMERGSELASLFQLAHGFDERGVFSENRVRRWQVRSGLELTDRIAKPLNLSVRAGYFQGRGSSRLEAGSDYYYVRRETGFQGADLDSHVEWSVRDNLTLVGGIGGMVDYERLPSRIAVAKQRIAGAMVDTGGVVDSVSVPSGHKTFANGDAYLHAIWQGWDGRVGATAGLRYDYQNIYGSQLSRRIGLVGSPRPNLHLKLLHGAAYQAPSPLLLYAIPVAAGDVVGNPGLRPQNVNTFEGQVEWSPSEALRLSTDVACNLLANKTEFVQQGINKVARNLARTVSVSWESEVEVKVKKSVNVRVNAELTEAVVHTNQAGYASQLVGTAAGLYPWVIVRGGVAAQLGGWPLRLAVLASYIGHRRASPTNILLNAAPYTLPPYVSLDANLTTDGFRILHGNEELSFGVSGKNLLGVQGPAPGQSGIDYPLRPRSVLGQVTITL